METTRQYHDATIVLLDNWRFHVVELDKNFTSLEDAQEAIDAADKKIQASKRVKLNLPALRNDMTLVVITGVHAGHGRAITKPATTSEKLYPDVPWIKVALETLRDIEKQVSVHKSLLREFEMRITGYSKETETPEQVQALHEELTAAALATDYESALKAASVDEVEFD